MKKGGKAKAKKTTLKFTIDCSTPVEDEIMDSGAFVSILWINLANSLPLVCEHGAGD